MMLLCYGMLKNKQARRKYLFNQRNARRAELYALLGEACVVCGSTKELEFHHKDKNEKTNSISKMLNLSKVKLFEEAKKCELRCRKHHQDVHRPPIQHGTTQGYGRGCRCVECKQINQIRQRAWREKQQ